MMYIPTSKVFDKANKHTNSYNSVNLKRNFRRDIRAIFFSGEDNESLQSYTIS